MPKFTERQGVRMKCICGVSNNSKLGKSLKEQNTKRVASVEKKNDEQKLNFLLLSPFKVMPLGKIKNGGYKHSNRMFLGTKRMFLNFWVKIASFSTNLLRINV